MHYNQEEISHWAGRQKLLKYQTLIERKEIVVGLLNEQIIGFGNIHCSNGTGKICVECRIAVGHRSSSVQ